MQVIVDYQDCLLCGAGPDHHVGFRNHNAVLQKTPWTLPNCSAQSEFEVQDGDLFKQVSDQRRESEFGCL